MTAEQRAAGLEKMARAICCPDGCLFNQFTENHPSAALITMLRDALCKRNSADKKATAALAAWEAHEAECSVSLPAEPTPEMCHAGAMAIVDRGIGDFYGKDAGCYTMSARLNSEEAATVYRAMTAAGNKKAPE